MRIQTIAAMLAAAGSFALASPHAEAQKFPSHLKNCKKDREFEKVSAQYVVPAASGGAGVVQVVSQNYTCDNKETRNPTWHPLYGMKDPSGKLVVPYEYAKVLPFSTTGALVIDHGKDAYPKNLMYRTYVAGKGEGKERFDFQTALMLPPNNGCEQASGDISRQSVTAVFGEIWFGVGGGKSHVTVFSPEGTPRKLEYVGGEGIKPAVRRVGDVLLARWRDDQGAVRSGILDLAGRPVAPVLSDSSLWVTGKTGPGNFSADGCNAASLDLFIQGPSLDFNPANTFFGPLLIPVGRNGEPATLPKGAVGMFAAYPRKNTSSYTDAVPNTATMWGVVFPKGQGFEFTLNLGSPSEALIAAEGAPRFVELGRSNSFGGMVAAKSVADGKWRTYRSNTDIVVGDAGADFGISLASAEAVLNAEASRRDEGNRAAWAKEEARRAADHKRNWETARAAGRMCQYRVDISNTASEVQEYVLACGPGNFAGLPELAKAKGMSNDMLQQAYDNELRRTREQAQMRAKWEEDQRVLRMQNANKAPGASYIPGQWESAIRNAGNTAVDAINKSSDNWLEQRRDQYVADWQRSQRAY